MKTTAKKTWKPSYATPSRKRLNTIVRATIATSTMGGMMLMAAPAMAVPGGGANTECGDGYTFLSKFDNLSGMSFSWTSGTAVDKVIVKAGTGSKELLVDGATSGNVDSSGMTNRGGQQPAISHVTLCVADDVEDPEVEDPEVEEPQIAPVTVNAVTPATAVEAPVVEAAVVEAPAVVAVPAAATVAAPAPATVAVPAAATIPTAVPAGGGSTQTDFPIWGVAMIAAAALAAAGAGTRLLKNN